MKTLLLPTDFSDHAKHAAEYAYHLASQMNANLILCNSVLVPAEMPEAGVIAWPMEELGVLMEGSKTDLKKLREHLEAKFSGVKVKPTLNCINEPGEITQLVNELVDKYKVDMVIMGQHSHQGTEQPYTWKPL